MIQIHLKFLFYLSVVIRSFRVTPNLTEIQNLHIALSCFYILSIGGSLGKPYGPNNENSNCRLGICCFIRNINMTLGDNSSLTYFLEFLSYGTLPLKKFKIKRNPGTSFVKRTLLKVPQPSLRHRNPSRKKTKIDKGKNKRIDVPSAPGLHMSSRPILLTRLERA